MDSEADSGYSLVAGEGEDVITEVYKTSAVFNWQLSLLFLAWTVRVGQVVGAPSWGGWSFPRIISGSCFPIDTECAILPPALTFPFSRPQLRSQHQQLVRFCSTCAAPIRHLVACSDLLRGGVQTFGVTAQDEHGEHIIAR